MEYLVLRDHLEAIPMHLPSEYYPQLSYSKDVKRFSILDDDDTEYFSGYIYNSTNACGSDYNEILEFMEYHGATKLVIDGEVIFG